jgi:hypothetical protein
VFLTEAHFTQHWHRPVKSELRWLFDIFPNVCNQDLVTHFDNKLLTSALLFLASAMTPPGPLGSGSYKSCGTSRSSSYWSISILRKAVSILRIEDVVKQIKQSLGVIRRALSGGCLLCRDHRTSDTGRSRASSEVACTTTRYSTSSATSRAWMPGFGRTK